GTRRSIRSDHYQIDGTSLHQMPAGAIGDDRMRDTMLTELPGSEFGALTSWPGLMSPDMNGQTAIMRRVDRRQGRSVIHKRKPARVAMGQDIDRLPIFRARNLLDEIQAVLADHPAVLFVFCGNLFRNAKRKLNLFLHS